MKISDIIEIFSETGNRREYRVMTGFKELDLIYDGWKGGELCVIGGRPGMGKTALIMSFISNIVKSGTPVALFTAVDSESLRFLSRITCNLLGKETTHKQELNLRLLQSANLSSIPFHLICKPIMTIEYIRSCAKDLIKREDIRCIFLETLQAVQIAEGCGTSREKMDRVCIELKDLARELNIAIIVTSDVNEECDNRKGFEGKQPIITDIPQYSTLEKFADSVWLLYRPGYYGITSDKNGRVYGEWETLISMVSHKYGGYGDVLVNFNPEKCCFEDNTETFDEDEKSLESSEAFKELKDKLELEEDW